SPEQEMNVAGYQLVYLGNIDETRPGVGKVTAQLQVWHEGQLVEYIYPGRQLYQNFAGQPASLISISTFGLTDLYVFLDNWQGPSSATIRVFVNPLVPLVWLGGLLMLLGGITCWWPERRRRRTNEFVQPEATTVPVGAGAEMRGVGALVAARGVAYDPHVEKSDGGRAATRAHSQHHPTPATTGTESRYPEVTT